MSKPRRTIDTATYIRFTARVIAGAGRRAAGSDQEELYQLLRLREVVDEAIVEAVRGLRTSGATWQDIADAIGVTRQAAFKRWHELVDDQVDGGEA